MEGKTIEQVLATDPSYLKWLCANEKFNWIFPRDTRIYLELESFENSARVFGYVHKPHATAGPPPPSIAKAATTAVHPATFATAPTESHRRRHAPSATAVRPATFAAAPTAIARRRHAPRHIEIST